MDKHDCRKFCQSLGEFLDGEIDSECCMEFETHIRECERCEIIVRTTRTTMRICQEHICEEIPDAIRIRVRKTIRKLLIQERLIDE